MDYEEQLGPYFFLLEETEVIAEAGEDWETWGPFDTYSSFARAWNKLSQLSTIETLESFGFFVLWDSMKSSLPEVCRRRFEEFPPNDLLMPGYILNSLLYADGFETFYENVFSYFSQIDDELEELIPPVKSELKEWWDSKNLETLKLIWEHSSKIREDLIK